MRNGQLGLLGVFMLSAIAEGTGCSGVEVGGAGGAPNSAGSGSSNGGSSTTGGMTGSAGASAGAPAASCSNVTPCGGSVVGSWKVTSSCLKLSGDMDVSLASLGCAKVPLTGGSLTTSGTFVANPDGTFTDNTTTTGSATFPLAKECLSISSVDRTCEQVSGIFEALGWSKGMCTETNGQCNCTVTADQHGGLGAISGVATTKGRYSTADNKLTTEDLSFPYCVAGDTLTITPQLSALTGSILLSKDSGAGGSGGASSTGGSGGSPATGGTAGAGGTTTGGSTGTAGSGGGAQVGSLPCDIYAAANTACVAAHSTVRALLKAYAGNLYQVKRASDGMTKDIPVTTAGGFADSTQQDTFCMGTTCVILKVYDQSGHGNTVEAEIPGLTLGNGANAHEGHSGMTAANASQESLMVGGHKVYSLYTKPSQAYWRDGSATGMPLGASPQGIYIVTSGKHFNGGCCYDYGNGEVSRTYVAGNTMDALYFGSDTAGWGTGDGAGPWVMADLEGGVFSGLTTGKNSDLKSQTSTYVTAMEKNNSMSELALKAADATSPTLNTYYKGKLPNGKSPGQKQGSIVLGSGGDCCYSNNNASQGTFYEGAIVAGYPSDATDEAVHANIVSTGYGK
jgi:hypothetical protein